MVNKTTSIHNLLSHSSRYFAVLEEKAQLTVSCESASGQLCSKPRSSVSFLAETKEEADNCSALI